jgi:hypothetical protein
VALATTSSRRSVTAVNAHAAAIRPSMCIRVVLSWRFGDAAPHAGSRSGDGRPSPHASAPPRRAQPRQSFREAEGLVTLRCNVHQDNSEANGQILVSWSIRSTVPDREAPVLTACHGARVAHKPPRSAWGGLTGATADVAGGNTEALRLLAVACTTPLSPMILPPASLLASRTFAACGRGGFAVTVDKSA